MGNFLPHLLKFHLFDAVNNLSNEMLIRLKLNCRPLVSDANSEKVTTTHSNKELFQARTRPFKQFFGVNLG